MQEKIISTFCGDVWRYLAFLILLFAAAFPGDIHTKFCQRSSVENALFRSIPRTNKPLSSKDALLNWLEIDFLDGFLADHLCFDTDEDCGISTGSIIVGNIILRNFYATRCLSLGSCKLLNGSSYLAHSNMGSIYERRLLKGFYDSYYIEDEWQVLTDQKFYYYDEMHDFVEKMNESSAASLEFLLFNPVLSVFTSVSLLFELSPNGAVMITPEILPVIISSSNCFSHYLKILFNLIFFIFILFSCKNQIWKMMKHGYLYWKQMWNYFLCFFLLVYFVYLVFLGLYVITCQDVMLNLVNTELSSNIDVTKVVMFESYMYVSIGILVFIHLLGSFKVLCFSRKLKNLLKRVVHSQKKMLTMFFVFFVVVFVSIFMVKTFIRSSARFSHPLFGFVTVIDSFLKIYGVAEISDLEDSFTKSLSVVTSLVLISIHIYLFSFIRSALFNYKSEDEGFKSKAIPLKEAHKILKRKFTSCFHPGKPESVSHSEYAPPIDFLLFELERLADTLVSKADSLFPKENDMEHFWNNELELHIHKPHLGLEEEILKNAVKACEVDIDEMDAALQERLIATIPRRNKGNLKAFMPSSFHASLGSERKFKVSESSTALQQNRIRKTYPLSHLDSDSPTSSTNSELDSKLDSISSLSVRKTKSRGKGKNEDFYLDIKNSDKLE